MMEPQSSHSLGLDAPNLNYLEKVRQQFDFAPYPKIPLERSPQEDYNSLFVHNIVTPYYLRHQKVPDTRDKLILDVGCGSGYKALSLAIANPQAKVIGIDLSAASIELAELRLKHHKVENAEFHAIALEDLPQLGLKFDYINCDEVLYLLPDPAIGLAIMRSALKPDGIIRTNLHSYLQRESFYQAQELFRMMGLMDGNPEEFEIEVVTETMKALKHDIKLKLQTWGTQYETAENPEQMISEILMNHLFQEDKGFTIPQLFTMLAEAELEFISMVEWQRWRLLSLFKDPAHLPLRWQTLLDQSSIAEQLQIYELLNPVNRLLDFWCGHPSQTPTPNPVAQWTEADWKRCTVHLHPVLGAKLIREHLINCISISTPFEISRYIKLSTPSSIMIDSVLAATLLPLWDAPQPISTLVERYLKMHPVHLATLEPVTETDVLLGLKQLLKHLETFCYILLEISY